MQTGYILGLLSLPIFLEGCCPKNHQVKITGVQPQQHYIAVEGEIFWMLCIQSLNQHKQKVWSRTGEGDEGNHGIPCETLFTVEAKHSGNYSSGSKFFLYLHVVARSSVGCSTAEESSVVLERDKGGKVPCPGLNCSNNTEVIWYKIYTPVSSWQGRDSCVDETGRLHLCQVYKEDTSVFFCDRKIIDQGLTWTLRRAVNVTAAPEPPSDPPRVDKPCGIETHEVKLGHSHTLVCEASFITEKTLSVGWYMNYGGNLENRTLLPMEEEMKKEVGLTQTKVSRDAIIEKVTLQHLNHTYTCIAKNSVGNSTGTIKLKKKIKVHFPSLVGYPFASLLLISGLGIILHVKWLEIQLIYRSRVQHGKHDKDEKEFDVFLSFVWSPSTDLEGVLTLSAQKGPHEEACLSSMDLLNTEEGKSTLEVLLPRVLEDQWGYRLCLLERDVLPGGAYTNDVVLAIRRSQMLICVLSAYYLSNSNALFVLESGVQALLQNTALKLLLIWTTRDSAALIQPDPPLPALVKRALKVLPSLDWSSGKTARTTSIFWRSLRKAMPSQRVNMVSLMQGQLTDRPRTSF
ncbi:interleukin-18 receptor accessory protein-like isoform X1 [Pseudochaenichthys georgianus]|uniref:interleukin-18 receptor accessory protein-like isoform X1 n=1 Tax=Pseudochaenichthys georgianus TaxID=52239 RepID=UPI00146F2416|nr:interleukin-18 receptor accessory protein-like isoform X1 [Pseudochaenichthys georgianus]